MRMKNAESRLAWILGEELAAVDSYRRVIREIHGRSAAACLRRIQRDHAKAARLLRPMVHGEDGGRSGGWGAWSRAIARTRRLFGLGVALKALRIGEEEGVREYEAALHGKGLRRGVRRLLGTLLPQARRHAPALEAFCECARKRTGRQA